MTRVLVVSDEPRPSDPLALRLREQGFTTALTTTGPEALDEFAQHGADLVLLSLVLPGTRGTEVCRALRARSPVPVIIVSTQAAEIDKVIGFELGADDYITRPYSPRELIARVRAVLRRSTVPTPYDPDVLHAGPVRMDVGRHRVTVAGAEVELRLKEFELLEFLLRHVGQLLTRGQILEHVWGAGRAGSAKTVDVHVNRLRSKIEPDPAAPRRLVTVRGVGYRITP